jgi:hypothetical protein
MAAQQQLLSAVELVERVQVDALKALEQERGKHKHDMEALSQHVQVCG